MLDWAKRTNFKEAGRVKIKLFVSGFLVCAAASVPFAGEPITGVAPDAALQKLVAGNKRYATDSLSHPEQTAQRRLDVAKGQHPFAVIVSCSDSRVPPEILFDQGIGDLFVIRTAGEVVTEVELGSIEYAVEHLGVQLVMVLGHERCGAVDATVKGGEVQGNIASIVELIKPAVEAARKKSGDLLENSIKANITRVAEKIGASTLIKKLVEENKVKIIRAYYDLDDGTVVVK
jgi:carbonic anhydrase